MSPDLRHATVFVKPLLGKDEAAVLKALRTNTAWLQKSVAEKMSMKYAAKLKFLPDESFDEANHIEKLLRDPRVARDLGDTDAGQSSPPERRRKRAAAARRTGRPRARGRKKGNS